MKKSILAGIVFIAACHIGSAQNFLAEGINWEHYNTGNQCYAVSTEPNSTLPLQYSLNSQIYDQSSVKTYTVTQLGNGSDAVFANGPALTILTTPSTLESINSYSCAYLPSLYEVVINGSPTIGNNAFYQDPNLQIVTGISNDIGDSAFENCQKLRYVVLKDGVTKIGKRAFANCRSLRSLTIPRTVVSIAPDAFVGSGLKYVVTQRGGVPINSFPKEVYVTVKQLPYPKK